MNRFDPIIQHKYGYIDDSTGEYVITRPDTPTPWINYIGQGAYGGIVSNTGGGYSFDRDPKNRRVTRYRYNSIPIDQPGRYVYIRDQDTGKYWSPTWQPITNRDLERYECRHGPGYTRISSVYQEIAASLHYFVPLYPETDPCPCEVWVLKIKNLSNRSRLLRTFSYSELSYWSADVDQTNLDWGAHILGTRQKDGVLLTSTYFRPTTTFFASSQTPIGFDSEREAFIGSYRDLSNPIVVETGFCLNTESPRGNNIASLSHDISLKIGEEKVIYYVLGVTDQRDAISEKVNFFTHDENVVSSIKMLKDDWDSYLSILQVHTPDKFMNAMLNMWNPIQCRATLFWSRFVSAYETGLGRGMGTRDSAQDTLATAQSTPKRARETLDMLLKLQFQDGHVWHQVYPLTGEGGPGLAAEYPEWPQWFSDDHLWLVQAVVNYVRETGDFKFLEEKIPYYDGGDDSIWQHILAAVNFTLNHRGPQRLPRAGFSDWDDTMNIDHGSGKAESVMTAQLFCWVMLELSDLCDALGKSEEGNEFRAHKFDMDHIINRVAWDGEWYARAFDDDGKVLGVKSEQYHQIALNTQTWAIISHSASSQRAMSAMDSVHEKLNTPFGLAILWPPYRGSDERVRGTSTYPPGAKENGGIFNHANTWAIIAAVKLGWADRAYQYYLQSMPLCRKDNDHFKVEPYVYCGNLAGPTHPQYGYGRNAWLSGTAAWMYIAATQWMLGIRPTFQGLRIAPVIPDDWIGFTASRVFRNVTYRIFVHRIGPGQVISIVVDGNKIERDIVPFPPTGTMFVDVKINLGS